MEDEFKKDVVQALHLISLLLDRYAKEGKPSLDLRSGQLNGIIRDLRERVAS
ncbi:MAG: hypothetical protein WC829_21000 [Hyphomicrobium sp.]|jgi:hypothetical protein